MSARSAVPIPARRLKRLAFTEEARSRRGLRPLRLVLLRWIGCSANATGGGLRLRVLHEPDARYHHGENDHTSYQQQRGHVDWPRSAA